MGLLIMNIADNMSSFKIFITMELFKKKVGTVDMFFSFGDDIKIEKMKNS